MSMPRSLKFNFLLSQRIRPANLIKLDFKMFAAGFARSFCPLAHWATNFQTLNLRVKNPMSPNLKPMFLFDR